MNRFSPMLVLLIAVAPTSSAETSVASGSALAFSADDPGLSWGACPEFMPEGCTISVLHGDPAGPNADVFFKVPGGAVIPTHWHSSAERMVLVSGTLHVSYEGQETRTLQPGMYAYGPPQARHSAVCEPGAPCVLFIAFEAPVDAVLVP